MKRIASLVLIAAFVFGAAVTAKADGIDVKVKGQWDFAFGWTNNKKFRKSYMGSAIHGDGYERPRDYDNFIARQRIRTQVNFITSEYLQGVLMFEIGSIDWGNKGTGGALDTDGVNVETKRAYLDWIIPNTEISVRMGLQGVALPATPMGSPVLEADVAGVVIASPITDWLSVSLMWLRPFDIDYNDGASLNPGKRDDLSDETDIFGIVLPFEFEGVAFTPWFLYGFIGANSGYYDYLFDSDRYEQDGTAIIQHQARSKGWWLGAHLELSLFEPLLLNLEGVYGNISKTDLTNLGLYQGIPANGELHQFKMSGWYIGATLDYQLDCMTPGIFGWYASGDNLDDFNDGRIGRLPMVGIDGGNFSATTFGAAGYFGVGNGDDWDTVMGSPAGTWGVGLQLADISFIEDLTHTLRVAYYRGTNDSALVEQKGGYYAPKFTSDALYLTDKDYVWEVNFDHHYQIYDNLEMVVELGWLRLHSDKDTWASDGLGGHAQTKGLKGSDNAWKGEVNFRYSF